MIEIRRKIVRREVWFDEPWSKRGADLLVFYHWKEPVNPHAAREVHSLEIDLTQDSEAVWRGFDGSTRNQINRAEKDGVKFEAWPKPTREIVNEFLAFQRRFALERGLGSSDPIWMHDYAAQNALFLTRAAAPDSQPLVWHSYARAGATVRQLHSVSAAGEVSPEQKRLTGKANRYLHWMDMLDFQKHGVERFDFGGWYPGSTDEKLLRVNQFKEQFGGVRTIRYHSMLAASAKGALYLKMRELLKHDSSLVHYV